jgi:hypothetical protein
MDRRDTAARKHLALPSSATNRKLRVQRETLKQLDARAVAHDSPRHALTAKCVTFNAGAIRGRNAA